MLLFVMTMSPGQSGRQDDIVEQCIERIAKGDKEALSLLYERTHAAVYGFALSILKNKHDAEDVVHEAYIRIWKAAGSYTPEQKPLAWMFTITRNLARMHLREQARTVAVSPEDWQNMFDETSTVDSSDRLMLAALLGSLSDEERQIVMLHVVAGFRHREIGEFLGLRLSTVLSKYSRALRKLRSALKEANRYE